MITTRTAARVASLPLCLLLAACGGSADRGAAGDTAAPAPAASAAAPAAPAAPAADSTGGQATAEGAPLDPNTATREQLAAVPGMTAAAADALVAGRPYADMVAVNRVLAAQVSDTAARKTIYARVWKPVDLNTAKAEEILLIPGVGRRMLHEFEEYRPYRDMARFRREIGKYVDSAEVARLERYVTIR